MSVTTVTDPNKLPSSSGQTHKNDSAVQEAGENSEYFRDMGEMNFAERHRIVAML